MTKEVVIIGFIKLFFLVKQIPRREMLAARAPIEIIVNMKEKINM